MAVLIWSAADRAGSDKFQFEIAVDADCTWSSRLPVPVSACSEPIPVQFPPDLYRLPQFLEMIGENN